MLPTFLIHPIMRSAIVMDSVKLHQDILSALPEDPVAKQHLDNIPDPEQPRWSKDPQGHLLLNGRIYVPESGTLRLHVLQYAHDHPVSGHFGINKTLEIVRRTYTWPGI